MFSKVYIERKTSMSCICLLKNKNGIVFAADSRETFLDGSFYDDYQKIRRSSNRKYIYVLAGLIKYKGIDYPQVFDCILNQTTYLNEDIENKLQAIQNIAKLITKEQYDEYNHTCRFDMFLYDTSTQYVYTLAVENGRCKDSENQKITGDILGLMAGENPQFIEDIEIKSTDTICHLIDKAKAATLEAFNGKTVGGHVNYIALDNQGNPVGVVK